MPTDKRTDAIFEAAEQLFDQLEDAIDNKDAAAQLQLAVKSMGLWLDWKRIEATQRVTLAQVMAGVRNAKTPEERRQKLLDAFKVTASVRSIAQDDLVSDELSVEADNQLQEIVSGLDALEPDGRKALAPILDSSNPDERVCAAVALLALMRDRAVAVLIDLVKSEPPPNASITALAALEGLE